MSVLSGGVEILIVGKRAASFFVNKLCIKQFSMTIATHGVSRIGLKFMASWRSFRPPLKVGKMIARHHSLGVRHICRDIFNNVVGGQTTAGPASFNRRYEIPTGSGEFLLGNKRRTHNCSGDFFKVKGGWQLVGPCG